MTTPDDDFQARARRDAETLAGLLGFTAGVQVSPEQAGEWLQGNPEDTDGEVTDGA